MQIRERNCLLEQREVVERERFEWKMSPIGDKMSVSAAG